MTPRFTDNGIATGVLRACLLATLCVTPLQAAEPIIPPPPDVQASSYLLIDAASQQVIAEHNAHEQSPPASLTKIMTSYLAEQEIAEGRMQMDDEVLVSVNAWRTGGSKMFIREGTLVSVSDLLRGIVIQSGNDASVAIAEHIGGSEDGFANMMNQQAELLGMENSHFKNATGLPDEEHYSSAWDLALLTRDLINRFPEHYELYSERAFTYNNINQPNRNRLLWRDSTVDGVKTGYTQNAGFCLVASAVQEGMRLISVVMGTDSDRVRVRESQKLLSYGFRHFETRSWYAAEATLQDQPVYYGAAETVRLGVAEEIVVTFPRGYYDDIEVALAVPDIVKAPLAKGDTVGEVKLRLHDKTIHTVPLIALEDLAEAGMFGQFGDFLSLFFSGLLGNE